MAPSSLNLPLNISTMSGLGAVDISDLSLLDGLTHLEEIHHGLEERLLLAAGEGNRGIHGRRS